MCQIKAVFSFVKSSKINSIIDIVLFILDKVKDKLNKLVIINWFISKIVIDVLWMIHSTIYNNSKNINNNNYRQIYIKLQKQGKNFNNSIQEIYICKKLLIIIIKNIPNNNSKIMDN